jgi:hypothetical protein
MSNNSYGAGVLALAEVSRAENNARNAAKAADERVSAMQASANLDEAIADRKLKKLSFAAKSQIHWLRSSVAAHVLAEDELIAALKAEIPDHPLADRDAVDRIVFEKQSKTASDPLVIKDTYPSGVLPEDAITIREDGRVLRVLGEPGFPLPSEDFKWMLDGEEWENGQDLDPAIVQAALDRQVLSVTGIEETLAADDAKKGFFSRKMKKDDREKMEKKLKAYTRHLTQLKIALPRALAHVEEMRLKAEALVRQDAAMARLKAWKPKG